MDEEKKLAVITPISERHDDIVSLYYEYKAGVESYTNDYEFLYILDGDFPDAQVALEKLNRDGEPIKIIRLSKWFGEAAALTAGFNKTNGNIILTLPAYYQIEPSEINKILERLDEVDMAVAWRWPRKDSTFNKLQAKIFHSIFNSITEDNFHDLGCGVRAFRRKVADEVPVYGDQHRFFPVLASRRGFRVEEIKVEQSRREMSTRLYRPGVYLRRLLDILTVFFLVKFTKKPLRFFGLIGSGTFAVGGLLLLYLLIERIFLGVALADRPLLLLASLLVVLGVQIFAIGLIGELIIFTHAKDIKEYTIEEIV